MDAIHYSVNNFLLKDATDRSKISSDHDRIFFDVSLYPGFHFSRTLPFLTGGRRQKDFLISIFHEACGLFCIFHEARGLISIFQEARGLISIFQEARGLISIFHEARGLISIFHEARGLISSAKPIMVSQCKS